MPWVNKQIAGEDWLKGFRQRHPELSLRKPEACSLAWATSYNETNLETFFNNLKHVLNKNVAFTDGVRLCNLDKTGFTNMQRP